MLAFWVAEAERFLLRSPFSFPLRCSLYGSATPFPYGFARTFGPLCSNDTVLKPLSYYKRNEAEIRVESVV